MEALRCSGRLRKRNDNQSGIGYPRRQGSLCRHTPALHKCGRRRWVGVGKGGRRRSRGQRLVRASVRRAPPPRHSSPLSALPLRTIARSAVPGARGAHDAAARRALAGPRHGGRTTSRDKRWLAGHLSARAPLQRSRWASTQSGLRGPIAAGGVSVNPAQKRPHRSAYTLLSLSAILPACAPEAHARRPRMPDLPA